MDRTTPLGLFNFGLAYIDTARAAVSSEQRIRFPNPIEFLCAHGLELIFKADLIRLKTLNEVRSEYGHRLLQLFADCSPELKAQYRMEDAFLEVVEFLADGHSAQPFENRYLRTGLRSVIEPSTILEHLTLLKGHDRRWLLSHFGEPN